MRNGVQVPPLSMEKIAKLVVDIRQEFKVNDKIYFPIVEFIEVACSDGFEIASEEDMGSNEGLTYPDLGIIKIREDVYDKAVAGDNRARFTMAHELGHLCLHQNIALARNERKGLILRAYENSEWQADEFAGNLLAPKHVIQGLKTASEISELCGISLTAAGIRLQKTKYR